MKYGTICLSDVERPLNFMMNKRSHNVVFVWSGYEFSHFSASTDLSCNQAFDKGTLQLLAPDGQMAIWG